MENETFYAKDPVSNVLKWVLLVVGIFAFVALGVTAKQTYSAVPPQPEKFVTANGETIMTAEDIVSGKAGFQRAGLMDHGSIYGMGSSFGDDYTAAYLHRLGVATEENISMAQFGLPVTSLPEGEQVVVQKQMQKMLQGVDLTQSTLVVPDPLANALMGIKKDIAAHLLVADPVSGWSQARSLNQESAEQTASFLLYSSLTTVARRPGSDVSWTQNWPYEPLVGNTPATDISVWTWASYTFTFLMLGVVVFIYEFYLSDRDVSRKEAKMTEFRPLTESQRKIGKYFLVVAAVFLVQLGAGVLMAHYYSDRTSFYGINIGDYLPFNFLRSLHIQAPIVWIGLAWIGSALFLAPAISGQEAKKQGLLVNLLFWVTLFVVAGGLVGNFLGIMNVIQENWFWFGNQGLSYIELGRFWQMGFFVGLLFWSILVMRALWPTWDRLKAASREFWTGNIRLENLIWFATINIAIIYAAGMIPLTGIEKSFSITDFWRWWVVHLWVEQSFEFFAVAISAYLLMETGLVSRRLAERAVYFELILIFVGGVLGTGHHFYWTGGLTTWVSIGSMFSFLEVLPLLLLITESISQYRLIKLHEDFKYKLAYLYILGAAFWNFVGAGVFGGGLINAPLVNYYEHGTFLTLNHAHASLFGAFGLLAIGLIYYCLRYAAGNQFTYSHKLGVWAFWLYNLGLVLWIAFHFFPIGWAQLSAVYEYGFAYARSLEFYNTTTFWQWMRLPGDVVFAAGAVLLAWDIIIKIKPLRKKYAAGATTSSEGAISQS